MAILTKGSLDIIGDSTNGLTSLQFSSTTTITNSGNINIENIKSAGSASDFVIAPANIDNPGTFTVSQLNAAATIPGTNFTLAPTGSFINTGTIDYDIADKGGTTNGFLYLGAITNNGVIKSGGFSSLTADGFYGTPSRYNIRGIIFNNALEGQGKVIDNTGAMILLNMNTLGKQTFNINQALYLINPKVVPESLKIENYVESSFVFLGVDFNTWNANNLGRLENEPQLNFGIDGHRYWLNMTWPGGWDTQQGGFYVVPNFPEYHIDGTLVYIVSQNEDWCPWLFTPITKTTTITTMDSITEATTILTVYTSTTNQYSYTVSEIIYQVTVPPLSTTYSTLTTSISSPITSTYTTTITNAAGSTTEEVVVIVQTPPLSTAYTTTISDVTTLTTSTYTTTVTDSNGSSHAEVVVVVITPSPSTLLTTTTADVTALTTSTFTTVVANSNGSSSTEVVVVVITPAPSTLSTTTTGAVSVPTTSTFTTVVTNSDGSSSAEVVVIVITPAPSTMFTTTAGDVSTLTTSTFTTAVTDSNGSSSTEVVVVIITPHPSGSIISTTTTGDVTALTTSTYTTFVTDSDGSSSTEVVVVVITPHLSVLFTTTTGDVTAPTTSTYMTVVTNSNGFSSTGVVVVVITPLPVSSFIRSSISISSPLYENSTISGEKTESTVTGTLVVLTTVVNGVTMTTTYSPEPSATSKINMITIIGHSSIESVYSKNQQEETNSSSVVSNATPVVSIVSTTTGSAFTNNENY
ncbi:uncharacterized protein PWA37_004465 [Arxiozyma heterogenica]|uniref:uncharacterized protein n=1 Tax=Arxiozyma heterogenica TaxID=278026 RepID=UPI002EF7ADB6